LDAETPPDAKEIVTLSPETVDGIDLNAELEPQQVTQQCLAPSPEDDYSFITDNNLDTGFQSSNRYCKSRQDLREYLNLYPGVHGRASPILPSLYISDLYAATSPTVLSQLGITHILRVCNEFNWREYPSKTNLEILCISIRDAGEENIEDYFKSSTAWIREALADGKSKVLVHCACGISRSPSIVIAYLMATRGLSYYNAWSFVQDGRQEAQPNFSFKAQLRKLENRINDRESVEEAKPIERQGYRCCGRDFASPP
jgi:atypical dual specificity phosphatase